MRKSYVYVCHEWDTSTNNLKVLEHTRKGDDSVLLNLEVLNGIMTLDYDPLIDTYTVDVASDVDSLVLNYELSADSTIKVINNEDLVEGENIIYLEVSSQKNMNTYTLLVNKENTQSVFSYENIDSLDVYHEKQPNSVLIGGGTFLIIIICFIVIFRPRRKHKKVK